MVQQPFSEVVSTQTKTDASPDRQLAQQLLMMSRVSSPHRSE
jgi:hypothetical protein